MSGGKRFNEFQYSFIPGPGYYKLPGFTDELIRKIQKKTIKKMKSNNGNMDMSKMTMTDAGMIVNKDEFNNLIEDTSNMNYEN